MDLLIQFAYPSLSGYGKLTISYTMKRTLVEDITFTTGSAIPLTYQDEKWIPMNEIYTHGGGPPSSIWEKIGSPV